MRGWGWAGWSSREGGLGAYRANPGEAMGGVGVGVSIFSRGCCPSSEGRRATTSHARKLCSQELGADWVGSPELLFSLNQGIWLPESDHSETKRCG